LSRHSVFLSFATKQANPCSRCAMLPFLHGCFLCLLASICRSPDSIRTDQHYETLIASLPSPKPSEVKPNILFAINHLPKCQ
jgi:hypothetical protein